MTDSHDALLDALGVDLPDDLLTIALTHRSYSYENGGLPTNERLEFLGDAVLGLTITEELYHRHPERSEGDLAKLRASIVNTQALADVGRGAYRRWPRQSPAARKGEENSGGADKSSILADGVESLLGAIYLQHGLTTSREVILRLFGELLDTAPTLGAGLDWKSSLQELTASRGLGAPSYVVTSTGPDHDKEFSAVVVVADVEYGRGVGRNKKGSRAQGRRGGLECARRCVSIDARAARGRGSPPGFAGTCCGQIDFGGARASPACGTSS